MQPCPNHAGAYDCTPFCTLCEGNQEFREYTAAELRQQVEQAIYNMERN